MTITLGTQLQANAQGDRIRMVELTSTTAIIIYSESAAAEINCKHATLSSGTWTTGTEENIASVFSALVMAVRLTDTSALLCWSDGAGGANSEAIVLTVVGTTVTANTPVPINQMDMFDLAVFNSTKCILSYVSPTAEGRATIITIAGTTPTQKAVFEWDAGEPSNVAITILSTSKVINTWLEDLNSQRLEGEVLEISGNTITGNASQELLAITGDIEFGTSAARHTDIDMLTSTTAIFIWRTSVGSTNSYVITESATVLSIGLVTNLTAGTPSEMAVATVNSTSALIVTLLGGSPELYEVSISETTITELSSNTTLTASGQSCDIVLLPSTLILAVGWSDSAEIISAAVSAGALSIATMTKPADIDADDTFIYVSLLQGGTPILTKINTDLGSDGTTVFNPGSGDNIGIQCGRFDNDVIWVGGKFDSTNKLEKSEDAGSSFTVKDDATFTDIETFIVGPDSDNRILVADETIEIQETINGGTTWTQINSSAGFNVNDIARLGVNVQESVFGNDLGATDAIDYSVNSGADMEDFTTGDFPTDVDVTGVIVN